MVSETYALERVPVTALTAFANHTSRPDVRRHGRTLGANKRHSAPITLIT